MGHVDADARIAVIGPTAVDIIFRGPDHWPADGETVSASGYTIIAGGTGLNSAIWLAALRGLHSVELFSRIGDDPTGDFVLTSLQTGTSKDPSNAHARLYNNHILRSKGRNTRLIFIRSIPSSPEENNETTFQLSKDGDRSMIGVGGAADDISEADIERAEHWLRPKDVLFISGLGVLPGFRHERVVPVLRRLHDKGVVIASDLLLPDLGSHRSVAQASQALPPEIAKILEVTDWIMCNAPEAEALAGVGENIAAAASRIFERYRPSLVAIKLQDRGAFIYASSELCDAIGLSSEGETIRTIKREVVDATGGGDSWCAGFIRGMLHTRGDDPRFAAKAANHIAAMCIGEVGATAVPPGTNWSQIVRALRRST